MKLTIIIVMTFMNTLIFAQQFNSEADIINYYESRINQLKREIDVFNSVPDNGRTEKDENGNVIHREIDENYMSAQINIKVNEGLIQREEEKKVNALAAFRNQEKLKAEERRVKEAENKKRAEASKSRQQTPYKQQKNNQANSNDAKRKAEEALLEEQRKLKQELEEKERRQREAEKQAELEAEARKVYDETMRKQQIRNAGRREALNRKKDELMNMYENVNTDNHHYEMLKGRNWNNVSSTHKDLEAFQFETTPDTRRKITQGDIKLENNLNKDVEEIINSFVINDKDDGHSEVNCDILADKIASYYGVSKVQLNIAGACDSAIVSKVNDAMDIIMSTANKRFEDSYNRWISNSNPRTWEQFSQNKTIKQTISIINIMNINNKGEMPYPIGSDEKYDYYALYEGGKLARVNKNGTSLSIVEGDPEFYLYQSLKDELNGTSKGKPMKVFDKYSLFNGGRERKYLINKDGMGKESYNNSEGKKISYEILSPRIVYKGNKAVVYNAFRSSEKETFDDTYSLKFGIEKKLEVNNFKFTPKASVKLSGSNAKASLSEDYGISTPVGDASISMNGTEFKSISVSGKYGFFGGEAHLTTDGAGVSGNVGIDQKIGKAKVGIGIDIKETQNGYATARNNEVFYDENSGNIDLSASGKLELGAVGISGKATGTLFRHTTKTIQSHYNGSVNMLPTPLQERLLQELIRDNNEAIYIDKVETSQKSLDNPFPIFKTPSKTEVEKMNSELLKQIKSTDIKDFTPPMAPSEFFRRCPGWKKLQ